MRKHICCLFFVLITLQFAACKKDVKQAEPQQQAVQLKNDLLTFAVNGQLYNATINAAAKSVNVIIPHTVSKNALTFNFSLSDQAKAAANNIQLTSAATAVNCSAPVTLSITSGDKALTTNWTINVQTDYEYEGMGSTITAEKSLSKFYNFYIDQFDYSTYQAINCGPTVTSMAIKWADSTFNGTPVDARNMIRPTGGWWYTSDIQNYLSLYGIRWANINLTNTDTSIKQCIDNGNLVILCLDMYYVNYNANITEHTDKFYTTSAAQWGHFLLVKGYKKIDNKFYLEIYDPYSNHVNYTLEGTVKGKDRYYLSTSIKPATDIWWPYAIVVAPKGKSVVFTGIDNGLKVQSTGAIPVAMGK